MNKLKLCSKACYQVLRSVEALPKKKRLLGLLFFILLFSCGPSSEKMKEDQYRAQSKLIADSVNAFVPGLSADTINGITHDFIKTAHIKFRVKDVVGTSNRIEEMTTSFGGYVSTAQLSSEVLGVTCIQTKKDSLLQSTQFSRMSAMRLRVPNKKLDSLLRGMSDLAEFIDYRNLTCDDVKLKLFANHQSHVRVNSFQSHLKKQIHTKASKLSEAASVEEIILNKQALLDQTEMESFELADQINYSSITVELYQAPQVSSYLTACVTPSNAYEPPLLEQLKLAFLHGLNLLKLCLIFVINYWGLFIFMGLAFIVFKKIPVFNKH